MGDYYTEDLRRLNGQPKKTIADYVEGEADYLREDIFVGPRFEDLERARRSHKGVFLRSEHPQDYGGVSGLLDSFLLSGVEGGEGYDGDYFSPRGTLSVEAIVADYGAHLRSKENKYILFKQYCHFNQIDFDSFVNEVSFSLWQYLKGSRRIVVADSAVAKRHHVTTFNQSKDSSLAYTVIEDGQIVGQYGFSLQSSLQRGIGPLIDAYEAIRQMEHFDSEHCPIMEFVTVGSKHYFLQYHRGRDFSGAFFHLDRPPKKQEITASFVRGATPPEGWFVDATIAYPGFGWKPLEELVLPLGEAASFDYIPQSSFPELLVRDRMVQIFEGERELILRSVAAGHSFRSQLFKPRVSVICDARKLVRFEEIKEMRELAHETGEHQHVRLHVISDGEKAYVSRVD